MVGTDDAICMDRRAVGPGYTTRLCGAKATILNTFQTGGAAIFRTVARHWH